jgi:transcription elongation factor Elf1
MPKKQKVTHNPGHCPLCGSNSISNGKMSQPNNNEAEFPLKCTACGTTFTETYVLEYTGVTIDGEFHDVDQEEGG